MSIVYRNQKDIPMPSFGYPNRTDGRVSIAYNGEDGKVHWKIIGHLTDSTPGKERMVPNEYFRRTFQDIWIREYPNDTLPPHEMHIGMYALTLGICEKTGLYSILQKVYGYEYVNNVLDYAMFSILDRSDITQLYESRMDREVLFSDKLYSDSWYSSFFARKLTEDHHNLFRIRWIEHLVKKGLKKVWLCIDGSNNDCEARKSFLARFGFPKSHNKNKTIVGYMYAVDSESGMPVTYTVYDGSVPDCQAFQKLATFLASFSIEIEGVILDRGFAVEEVFRKIEYEQWKYVVMLPADTYGHTQMVREHSEEIRWKSEHVLDEDALFGIADEKRLFGNHDRISNICLYFDGASGSGQSIKLIKKIQIAKRKAESAIESGKRAGIEKRLRKYLTIEGEGAERRVIRHYEEWDKSMAASGFFSIAASRGMNPQLVNSLYKKRAVSETQFCILKSQEGGSTTRVHKTSGIYSKFALLFISSIIRFHIEQSCQRCYLDTNPTIQDLDRIALIYTAESKYEAVRNLTLEQKELFSEFGINQDDIERFAIEFNSRSRKDSRNPERKLPNEKTPLLRTNTRKVGRPPKENRNPSGETKTVSHETDDTSTNVKSKGGRPKGRKDSKPRKPRSDKGKKRGSRKT